ncbi:hypothetical protein ACOTCG_05780 [Achromobacter xylosoxidans]
MNYSEISVLSNFYLEDSYVLSINETAESLIFEIEAVLMKSHPKYEEPKKGEQYCYHNIFLQFFCVTSIEWIDRRYLPFEDSAGERDYGNIDSFIADSGSYILSGDWGTVIVRGGEVDAILAG